MALTNQTDDGRPPPTRSQILASTMTMAMSFSTCVESFQLIHPQNYSDHHQRVAVAKLGIQQGRLLIWGDVMGISSPPSNIARHMIPSHPGVTNPDPTVPINFAIRDPRLDQADFNARIRAALEEIAGRPSNMSRETLMLKYGLKSPKNFSATTHAALDTNRLEAFREKFALLKDLVRQVGVQGKWQRAGSMTMQKWTVRHSDRFDDFVALVRQEVDGLITMMGVKEQVDRGMKLDIKSMAWHPDLSVPVVRADWDKLKLIREAVAEDYPEYEETADRALRYISDELREHHVAGVKLTYTPPRPARRRSSTTTETTNTKKPLVNVEPKSNPLTPTTTTSNPATPAPTTANPFAFAAAPPTPSTPGPDKEKEKENGKEKERKPSLMAKLGLKSWGRPKSRTSKKQQTSTQQPDDNTNDPPRSFSEDIEKPTFEYCEDLTPVRSKSLSAVRSPRAANSHIDSIIAGSSGHHPFANNNNNGVSNGTPPPTNGMNQKDEQQRTETDEYADYNDDLSPVETARSLVDRHDMYRDLGRIETKDIRQKSKEASLGY